LNTKNDKEIGNFTYYESYNNSILSTEVDNQFELKTNSKTEKSFYLETYGCQMNENDSEIISTILFKNNFKKTENIEDVIIT